jgi:hypothetical protein
MVIGGSIPLGSCCSAIINVSMYVYVCVCVCACGTKRGIDEQTKFKPLVLRVVLQSGFAAQNVSQFVMKVLRDLQRLPLADDCLYKSYASAPYMEASRTRRGACT